MRLNVAADPPRALLRNSDYLLAAIKKTTDLPAVIVVDQFEDLFTLCRRPEAAAGFPVELVEGRSSTRIKAYGDLHHAERHSRPSD